MKSRDIQSVLDPLIILLPEILHGFLLFFITETLPQPFLICVLYSLIHCTHLKTWESLIWVQTRSVYLDSKYGFFTGYKKKTSNFSFVTFSAHRKQQIRDFLSKTWHLHLWSFTGHFFLFSYNLLSNLFVLLYLRHFLAMSLLDAQLTKPDILVLNLLQTNYI